MIGDAAGGRDGVARWSHRNGLDGLRCVAVLLVVGFHSEITWLSNGYIGVDVFFALSGYLVTTVILQAGLDDFSFSAFYGRRVRRLLPAAVVGVVVTCLALLLYVPRLTRAALVGDAQAALLYVANWRFIGESTDYFANDVESSPFLHYWSLAIEEQFYLVYPIVLIGAYRIAARRTFDPRARLRVVVGVIAALVAISTTLQIWWATTDPARAYFGTDARLYQILLGAAAAGMIHLARDTGLDWGARVARPLGPICLGAIGLLATDVVSTSASTRGIVVAIIAVALVVSLDIHPASWTSRGLGRRTPKFLGQISYMIYLAHWPVILCLRAIFELEPVILALVATLISAGLAALSHQLLEQPIRTNSRLARRPRITVGAGLATSCVAAIVLVPWILQSEAKPSVKTNDTIIITNQPTTTTTTAPPTDTTISAGSDEATVAPGGTVSPNTVAPTTVSEIDALLAAPVPADLDFATATIGIPGYECGSSDAAGCVVSAGGELGVHVIGDSNASMFMPMFEALSADIGFTYSESSFQGCPFQRDLATTSSTDRCFELRSSWYERLATELTPDVIIAVNLDYEFEPTDNRASWIPVDGNEPGQVQDRDATRALFEERTVAAIDALTTSGATVVLVEPIGYNQDLDPTACLSGASTVGECTFARPELSDAARIYRKIAAERSDVVSLDLDSFSCPYSPACLPLLDGHLVFRDPTHLSIGYTVAERMAFWNLLVASGAVT